MPYLKVFSYSINLLAGIATIVIGILAMDSFSLAAFAFLVWAITPYLFSAFRTRRSTHQMEIMLVTGLSFIIAIGGIFLLIDAIYIHPDAQSALAFVVIPGYQWIMVLIAAIPVYLVNKKYSKRLL